MKICHIPCYLAVAVMVLAVSVAAAIAQAPKKAAAPPHKTAGTPVKPRGVDIGQPITAGAMDWLETELAKKRPMVLTNAYLFQVMKGIAQETQKAAEQNVLLPLLRQVLHGLADGAKDPHARRLFGVPLLILDESAQAMLPPEIAQQAAEIASNPLFKPRGHYTESAELRRFFVAMQYLSKATIDSSIDPTKFPFPREMLFPFETAHAVRDVLADPANRELVEQWLLIHWFYTQVNGPPDLPTFKDILDHFPEGELGKQDIAGFAEARGIPRINPERGLGIQPFGERFMLHEAVIDEFKVRLFNDDTPRDAMAKTLTFQSLLAGINVKGVGIEGLAARIVRDKDDSYYSTTLRAIEIGARGWQNLPLRRNFCASALTSLAEQTVLMTKTSTIIQKSAVAPTGIPPGVRLFFQPGSEKFLLGLAEAVGSMVALCNRAVEKAGVMTSAVPKFSDPAEAFRFFATQAKGGKPLVTGNADWDKYGQLISRLKRRPAVTVDVFHVRDRSGTSYYFQWATAPFDATHPGRGAGVRLRGMEMVFFEGWSDQLVPGSRGPLDNAQWEERLGQADLNKIPPILTVLGQQH